MTDKNNIPQQAEQLSRAVRSKDGEGNEKAAEQLADTNFDKEYEMAQDNNNGSGTQSSDPNPVNRKDGAAGTGDISGSNEANRPGDASNSPGDSDPADYMDMAREVTSDK